MTTIIYLSQLKNIDKRIKDKLSEAQQWRMIAESGGHQGFENDKVQTSPPTDPMAQAIVNAIANEQKASELALKLTEIKQVIIEQIDGIEDAMHYNILKGYFVNGQKFTDLASEVHTSYRNIKRYFNKALSAFEAKYGELYINSKKVA